MRLKDDMARDLDEVFLNEDDFAEVRSVGSKRVKCVLYETAQSQLDEENGRGFKAYTLQAKKSDLPPLRAGDVLIVDGKTYTVSNVRVDYGMGIIELIYAL